MRAVERREAGPREVASAFGSAASQLGTLVSRTIDEQPAVALAGALAAGFIAGGGLVSPLGLRIATTTLRATLGNVAAITALDLLRRELKDGGARGNSGDTGRAN